MNTANNLIRIKQVQQRTSLSKSYIYQLVHKGLFPKPVSLVEGGSSVAWIESEVDQYIENRIASRSQEV